MSDLGPLVSVIMPTFNRAALLRRSILSVLAQTYRNFELIVVDDCSSDNTPEIIKEFVDPRLRYIRRASNGRAAAARNEGIAAARGELIAFQDDDDIWLPHKLERQVPVLVQAPPEVGVLLCAYMRWHRHGVQYIGGPFHESRLDFKRGNVAYIDYSLIATPAWLVRRHWLAAAGEFDTRFRSWDDWELALRLWKICRLIHINEPLFIQDHVLGSQMMFDERGKLADMKLILEKHGALWDDEAAVQAAHYFFIGWREIGFRAVAEGQVWLKKAVEASPRYYKAWIVLCLSYLGIGGMERGLSLIAGLRQKWWDTKQALRRFWAIRDGGSNGP